MGGCRWLMFEEVLGAFTALIFWLSGGGGGVEEPICSLQGGGPERHRLQPGRPRHVARTARTCGPDGPDMWPRRPGHVARTARTYGPDGPDMRPGHAARTARTCGPDGPDAARIMASAGVDMFTSAGRGVWMAVVCRNVRSFHCFFVFRGVGGGGWW